MVGGALFRAPVSRPQVGLISCFPRDTKIYLLAGIHESLSPPRLWAPPHTHTEAHVESGYVNMASAQQEPPVMRETPVRLIPWRRDGLPTPIFLGIPGGSDGNESTCNAGDLGSIPGLGRCPGEGNGYPL